MEPIAVYFLGLGVATALLTAVWAIQLITRNAGLVDVVWSACMGLMGLLYAGLGSAPAAVRILLALMAALWAFRLAGHLAWRMRGQPEDSRYAGIRAAWGERADFYMLLFFWFQALMAWILSLPFLVVAYSPATPPALLLLAAVAVWLISVAGEAAADYQLYRFKRDPANASRVCTRGLWRYSRHPNYFFESLQWVSYALLALGSTYWWAAWASPVIMAWLLLRVSGIPTVESGEGKARRAGYDEYIRTTSAFIPLPPKR